MRYLHRHRGLVPYLLLAPGLLWLAVFFVVPLGFLVHQSLQSGSFEFGYVFDWSFGNYWDAIETYHEHLIRSLVYAGLATAIALVVSYPLVYWIAFRGGRWKNLFLLAIIAPFFVTYLIRTLAWQSILSDSGFVLDVLRTVGIVEEGGRLLATPVAVVAGLTYNFLPFMALPLYVALEQIDARLLEAAQDLYASKLKAFLRVTLPLSLPGIFAGTLLTFIPAAGDFINAQLLGTPREHMIGNVIQSRFLDLADYPAASALSFVLMAAIVAARRHLRALARDGEAGLMVAAVRRHALTAYALLAFGYLLLPIAVVIAFSFNDPAGRFNYTWQGFTFDNWRNWNAVPGLSDSMILSLEIAALASVVATALGTLIALALVRHGFRGRSATNLLIFLPMSTPEIVLGASLLALFLSMGIATGFATIAIAHIMFVISYAVVTVKARLVGFDRHLEEAAMDLGADEWTTFRKVTLPLIWPAILSALLLGFALSLDDFVITYFVSGSEATFPVYVWGAARIGAPPQVNVIGTAIFVIALTAAFLNVLFQARRGKGIPMRGKQ